MESIVKCRYLSLVLGVLGALLVLPGLAAAQQAIDHASVAGRVTDPSGAVVTGATVFARHLDTNLGTAAVTDGEGRFRFPYLRVGRYDLQVRHPGFAPASRQLTLGPGAAFEMPFVLALDVVSTAVSVAADAPVLESA